MDLREQLQALGLHKGTAHLSSRPKRPRRAIEDLVEGQVVENEHGAFYLADQRFSPAHFHGKLPLGAFLPGRMRALAHLAKDKALNAVDPLRIVFLDTETTGLAGGTGTYAFLVGIGYFEPDGSFAVQQFFMRDYGEELAQLYALADVLGRFEAVVSFNGKGFDLPLMATRFALSRLPFGLASAPHLDLLPPARLMWKRSLASCALSSLERCVLGVRRSGEDVPGYLIPALYFDYLRGGDAGPLAGVFYHNVQDVLSMVTLATHLSQAFDEPHRIDSAPNDMLGLARMYEDAGMIDECEQAYAWALQGALPAQEERWALQRLSSLLKRAGRRQQAADIWRMLVDDRPDAPLYAYIELAKYHEWFEVDLPEAARLTECARTLVARWPPGPQRRKAQAEVEHRLARLERKLSGRYGRVRNS